MTISRYRDALKKIPQLIAVSFFLLIPFLKTSNGESLLRFDVGGLKLYFFGTIVAFDNFFLLSLAIILFAFIFILVTQIFGRLWCGWLCPQSFFSRIVNNAGEKFKNPATSRVFEAGAALLSALVLSLNWMWYFISPYVFFSTVFSPAGRTALIFWLVILIFLFVDFMFARFLWCRYACPYAKILTVMSDDGTLYIGLKKGEEERCVECGACLKKCPVKIDPRATPDNACVYCEKCIKTCSRVMAGRGGGVLGYNWGEKGEFTLLRPNVVITAAVTILLATLFAYHAFFNEALYAKSEGYLSRQEGKHYVELKLKNGGVKNIIVTLQGPESVVLTPSTLSLRAGEKKKARVFAEFTDGLPSDSFEIKLVSNDGGVKTVAIRTKRKK